MNLFDDPETVELDDDDAPRERDGCICEFSDGCGGMGTIHCSGCGGDLCVCGACGGNGEIECPGCDLCAHHRDDGGFNDDGGE